MQTAKKPAANFSQAKSITVSLALLIALMLLLLMAWQYMQRRRAHVVYITQETVTAAALLNLNTATANELRALPGIGAARAAAIISYRSEHGGFDSIEELRHVAGIGEKTFAMIAPYITV
ncbi:MAG: helix-hairpin-helix domain-containing protein [Clostridia bacterium]|nr:helix-hairpin-helix domain-containing protein [Clostridia bacterium]